MMIKSVAVETKESPKYPILKVYDKYDQKFVVLFTEPGVGMVVYTEAKANHRIGEYNDKNNMWLEGNFVPYNGSITLSND